MDTLNEKIRQLEETVQDVEEKNKRLVDLLNANIYNKAEQYKEKVMTRLLERSPISQTPAINVPPVLQQLTI
jgi:cell shape-determining protein MreC